MNKSKIINNLKYILIFIIGLSIASYPLISRWYYNIEANNQVNDFEEKAKLIEKEEIDKRIKLAQIYNKILDPSKLSDPYSEKEKKAAVNEYAKMLEVKEKMGHVEIPKINVDLPIYAGTTEDVLQMGVGHLEGTSLPVGGNDTHTVLTAHRGLPTAKLFSDLDKMEKGDVFFIHNIKEVLAYKIVDIYVVEPSDFEKVLVVPGKDYATLLTCTPYMINSHRLLVRGERIEYTPELKEKEIVVNSVVRYERYLKISLIIIVILLAYYIYQRKRNKK